MTWQEFSYEALPGRVVFGAGRSAQVAEELDRLGVRRALVLCTPGQHETALAVAQGLGKRTAGIFADARMHVPVATVTAASTAAREAGADTYVAVGGGSTIGLGKGLALRHGLPVVAVPTTYAGSEMTPIWGLTEDGVKRTGRDRAVLPRTVIYDPELTSTLPAGLAVTSGLNALAHAVEGLYAPDASPITSLMAEEGARALTEALPSLVAGADVPSARAAALYGAWLCGTVLGATTMSLHHKLCHVLGGSFDLPHAEVHSVILPYVLSFNAPAAPAMAAAMGRVLKAPENPGAALWQLARDLGAPASIAEIGMPEHGLVEVRRQVVTAPYANPRSVTADDVDCILRAAYEGSPPHS
ncbi:maleylacetate reductase [Streptomyces krungchingensis]